METRLIESLHHKLGDLDHKVRAYRHDLLADFQRYYHDQLRGVNPAIATNVGHAIALSMANYQSLRPDLDELIQQQPAESRDPSNPGSASFQPSPPSSVFGAAEAPTELHEREQELQGLFTPSYLPLLDSLPVSPRPLPAAAYPASASAASSVPRLPESKPEPGFAGSGQGAEMNRQQDAVIAQEGGSPPIASPQGLDRPGHVRRSTDDTTSSVVSDRSDTKVRRRSALRHSSSPAKIPISPRRVRFEFEGAEVLPTSSPEPSDTIFSHASSTQAGDGQLGSRSILGDEDEHEKLPPPRKISSSEALRALSRTPLEEGTVWTVVDPNTDKSPQAHEEMPPPISVSPVADETDSPTPTRDEPVRMGPVSERVRFGAPLGSVHEEPDKERESDEGDSSGDEFLAMAKTRKPPSSPKQRSPDRTRPSSSHPGDNTYRQIPHETKPLSPPDEIDAYDDDELFQFEPGGGLSAPPRPRPVTPPAKEDDADEEVDVSPHTVESITAESPAVPITKPTSPRGPSTPTTARFQAGSVGSYKGRPVLMPVVRNPEVHAQAASLGQFNTFVGGLDGRSGMDEGDLNSFRASLVQSGFSGTPRSLTERLMMEEAMERRQDRSRPQ
ncbi:hypothetical protein HJFPF1_03022 [Paramyrothecium foliicola]|nr:hypothetical protein HJFPF1_03022 [Paramyrothecium foliicola]